MLPDLSESLTKGRNRILGTLVGVCLSLVLLGLFYQDRWPLLLCMALWLSVCTYLMGGSARSYFWLVAGFVVPIIALRTGMDGSATAFLMAVERTQETLMGICVYTLVSVFVWPEQAQEKVQAALTPAAESSHVFPDLDRLVGAVYVFATFLLGALLVIYLPAFPNHGYVLAMLPAVSMAIATMPFVPLRILYRPLIINILLGAAIVVLVLPHLTSFSQLAVLLFAMTFAIAYHFFDPAMVIGRSVALPFFFVLIHISNEQQHDFLYTVNLAAMLFAAMLILLAMDHFPVSRLPEKRFAWQLRRFLRSAHYLVGNPQAAGPLLRYRRAFHLYEVAALPQKLAIWKEHIPAEVLEGNTEQVEQLLAEVNRISERLRQGDDVKDSLDVLNSGGLDLCLGALVRPRFF